MNWLARLKKIEIAPERDATEPTKPDFVGFVAPNMAPLQKTGVDSPAANDPTPDPDRWCWPHSEAINTREIDTFKARMARFTDKGLGLDEAEALADKLVKRDREPDDRRLCFDAFTCPASPRKPGTVGTGSGPGWPAGQGTRSYRRRWCFNFSGVTVSHNFNKGMTWQQKRKP